MFLSTSALWNRVAEPVARMRRETGMLRLFPEYLKGEEMFGLTLHAVLRIAESVSYFRFFFVLFFSHYQLKV